MTTADQTYDVIVLGAGSTGENVASTAVQGGLSAAIVESELVGGECSYWACMPSKALLRGTEVLGEARAVSGADAAVTGTQDVDATLARRTSFTSNWDDASQVTWVDSAGIALLRGQGRLDGEKTVVVTADDGTTTRLIARQAVAVCTGSQAKVPPLDGIEDVDIWTSRDATSAKQVPGRLVILGGGVVGCEMATAWQALGAQVTLLQRGSRLLTSMEPEAGDLVADALRDAGVDVRLDTSATGVRRDGSQVVISIDGGEVTGDEFLVATGRRAHTGDIGLDTVGLNPGDYLDVDESLRVTGTDWLYSMGDANGRSLLTHMGKYQARQGGAAIVARAGGKDASMAAWSPFVATADAAAVPQVVFTQPQVASIGLTAQAAADAGREHTVVRYDLGSVAGAAVFADGYTGKAIAVVDNEREVLLGVTFVGAGVSEMLQAATIAVVGEVPIARLWHAVPAYPTMNEVWLRLLETYQG